ncbi:MAG: deoxyribose-phosphate aldolase [Lentimicrobiaceae bacterium]|nr:deoxyribose-phosphate aldolase [Lentimicrobiaceae bacterium]
MLYSLNIEEIDETIIRKRVNKIIGNLSFPEKKTYATLLNCIDLTTLEGADTREKVMALCYKATTFREKGEEIPNVAAVCVYPTFVSTVKKLLKSTGIKTASVAGAFPSGQSPLHVKLAEIQYAVDEGADEIDMVISRGKFLEGEYNLVFDEIAAIRETCKSVHLKVILETGELSTLTNISRASRIALYAGADFIKTSTGKIPVSATEPAVLVMLDAIKDYFEKTGKKAGIKPSGGISEPWQALNYYALVHATLGESWLSNTLFRLGASRLADNILKELIK